MLTAVEKKLRILTHAFHRLSKLKAGRESIETSEDLWETYHNNFLAAEAAEEQPEEIIQEVVKPEEDLFEDSKTLQNVPNRKQIKLLSAKIVEELSKKEE